MNEKISYEGKRFLIFLFNMEQQCGQRAKLAKNVENLKNHKGKDVYPCKNQENAQKKIVMVKIFIKVDVFFEVGIWNKILNILDQLATTGRLKLEDQGNGVETLHSKSFGSWAGVVIGSFYIFRGERLWNLTQVSSFIEHFH